jgi:hypothetical protein
LLIGPWRVRDQSEEVGPEEKKEDELEKGEKIEE